jgi:hypothetical protein
MLDYPLNDGVSSLKRLTWLMLILMTASFACSLAVDDGSDGENTRPVLEVDRPAVILIAPKNGSRYVLGTEISIYAEARDLGSGVARIEVFEDFDTPIGKIEAAAPQEELSGVIKWKPIVPQTYLIRVQAFRADDTASSPQEISIEVVASDGVNAAQPAVNATEAVLDTSLTPVPVVTLEGVVRGASALNVRSQPDANSARIAQAVSEGEVMQLIGRSEDQQWYLIRLANGDFGWVFGQFVVVNGDPNTLPTVKPEEINP